MEVITLLRSLAAALLQAADDVEVEEQRFNRRNAGWSSRPQRTPHHGSQVAPTPVVSASAIREADLFIRSVNKWYEGWYKLYNNDPSVDLIEKRYVDGLRSRMIIAANSVKDGKKPTEAKVQEIEDGFHALEIDYTVRWNDEYYQLSVNWTVFRARAGIY